MIEGEGFAVYDMAADENYLHLVGTDSSMDQWRIEKRFLSNGSFVSSFGSNGVVLTNHSAWGECFCVWKLQLRGPGKPFCEVASNIKIWGVANALRRMKIGCRIPW
ncbi:hypothetical protein [Candidatus Hadarchaeum sp.]|uniref:hypothetical protein n=1 Tax=Candidatus Hadarchaeum sp. TaxID=2883567 RepID=UPI00319DC907